MGEGAWAAWVLVEGRSVEVGCACGAVNVPDRATTCRGVSAGNAASNLVLTLLTLSLFDGATIRAVRACLDDIIAHKGPNGGSLMLHIPSDPAEAPSRVADGRIRVRINDDGTMTALDSTRGKGSEVGDAAVALYLQPDGIELRVSTVKRPDVSPSPNLLTTHGSTIAEAAQRMREATAPLVGKHWVEIRNTLAALAKGNS